MIKTDVFEKCLPFRLRIPDTITPIWMVCVIGQTLSKVYVVNKNKRNNALSLLVEKSIVFTKNAIAMVVMRRMLISG